MDLQALSKLQDRMDDMTEAIYDLTEALMSGSRFIGEEKEKYKISAKQLSMELINSTTPQLGRSSMTPYLFLERIKGILYPPLGVTHEMMVENRKSRNREYVMVRQIIMAASFCVFQHSKDFKFTLKNAGSIFSKKHDTVIYSIKIVNSLLDTDKDYKETYSDVWTLCKQVNPKSKLHI